MEKITGKIEVEQSFLEKNLRNFKNIAKLKAAIEVAIEGDLTILIKNIMAGSIQLDSSDLHLETNES